MFTVSRISKNLIAVSFFSTMLVIWLGSRYLSDAHILLTEATQLERSVTPENTLFKILNSIDQERTVTQRILLSEEQQSNETQKLRDLAKKSKELFRQARTEITQSRNTNSSTIENRHSQNSIDLLFDEIEDHFKRISVTRFVIAGQTQRAIVERDENVRMQLFDIFGKFIDSLDRLRQLNYTYPSKEYIKVLDAHDSRDAIWLINESINQTSTLISSYLLKRQSNELTSFNVDNFSLRILQQHERISTSLSVLDRMVTSEKNIGTYWSGSRKTQTAL